MINVQALEKFFTESTTPKEFAEVMHAIMTDYVRMACFAEGKAELSTLVWHIDLLEELRQAVLVSEQESSSVK